MTDYRNERWMEENGGVRTVRLYPMKSEFGANKTEYKIPGWIAFNVGKDVALHIVANQNYYLDKMVTMGFREEK